MLKAFPQYAIGTAILLSGCQTPGWMTSWKHTPEQPSSAVAENDAAKKSLLGPLAKKPSESSAAATSNALAKGQEQLRAYSENPSRPQLLQDAEKNFERALLVDPKNPDAHHGLAVCLDLQKRYPAAEEHYKTAIAQNHRNATYIADLGYSFFLQGRYADAEKTLSGALQVDPNNQTATANLAMTYAKQGKRDQAESTLRRVKDENEVRRVMAEVEKSSDIKLASGEQAKPPAKDGSWNDVQARMEQARTDSLRQREQRDQQSRAAELGLDPARIRQMQMMQAQGGDPRNADPRGADPRMAGVDPRDYRGRDPYADMKNQIEALDRSRTNVANGPVYLDQSGFQSVPHQTATFPEAQQAYHPGGPIQPLAGQQLPPNAGSWTPGAQSPHVPPGANPYANQVSNDQGSSLVPPPSASPYYQGAPDNGGAFGAGGGYTVPPQYQSGYGPGPGPQTSNAPPMVPGQSAVNAFANRGSWGGAAPGPGNVAQQQPPGPARQPGYSQPGYSQPGSPQSGYPMPGGYGIQQTAAEQLTPNTAYDPGRAAPPARSSAPREIPGFPGAGPEALAAYEQFLATGQIPSFPSGPANPSSLGSDFEQAKREAAMHGLGVGPGPLFPSSSSTPAQPGSPNGMPGMPPQGQPMGFGPQGPAGMSPGGPMPPNAADPRGAQPGDGLQQPGIQWNGAQYPPVERQLPTDIQVPDLRNAGQPQYESNWDLYRQQTNQYGQQTAAPSASYRSQNQYSANSGFGAGAQPGGAPLGLPAAGAMTSYDNERSRLARANEEQQAILLRSPADAVRSPATEQRNYGPAIPSPSDQMIQTWGNQSIVPPAWPSRTSADSEYRARGYDTLPEATPQYDRGDNGASARGIVVPDRYSSAQRPTNSGTRITPSSQSNESYSNSNSGLPAIVPGSRNGY